MLTPMENIKEGDTLIGIPSNGLHTNGYSLVRHVFQLHANRTILSEYVQELGETLGEALLRPHPSYYSILKPVFQMSKGIAHITGGGLYENMPRMLPSGLAVRFDASLWESPPVFQLIQKQGGIDIEEMYRVYNMGLGMVVVCEPEETNTILGSVKGSLVTGEVVTDTGSGRVLIENM